MIFRFRRRIKPNYSGGLDIRLDSDEQSQIQFLAAEVQAMLEDPTDPALRRLFPPAYADDAARDAAYQMLMGDDLRQSNLEAVKALKEGALATTLDLDGATAWMQAINATRLILGTRLDITDDQGPITISPDDPNLPMWIAYEFLSQLLAELVEAMSKLA